MTDSALPRLTIDEAVTRFGVCKRTLFYWISKGKLDTTKISHRRYVVLTPRTIAFAQWLVDPDYWSPLL